MAVLNRHPLSVQSMPGIRLFRLPALIFAYWLFLYIPSVSIATEDTAAAARGKGCMGCHAGIMDIVPVELPMMKLILQNGLRHGDMDGCVICHGGTPSASKKEAAHRGIPKSLARSPGPKDFYPNPGAIHIAQNTCGVCHPGYVYRLERSLMNTGAGKIQGNLSSWGARQGVGVIWGNHDIEDPDGPLPLGTTLAYESYMGTLRSAIAGPFPATLKRLPLPPLKEIQTAPEKAAFIYQRKECQSCHLKVKGRQRPGNFRGTGCGACHMRYATDGIYRGKDQSIPQTPGHILAHRISGNRKTGGIPVATCRTCHSRSKGIAASFEGLMPSASPVGPRNGNGTIKIREDLHHRKESRKGNPEGGLLCQDCHTSMDVHGDGNIQGTTLAQVEIECTDCHGTPERFPWELPLGHGDEFGLDRARQEPRGIAETRLLSGQQFGVDYDGADGYILSARGNPLGNVVRRGDGVIVHSATGKDFKVPVLKSLEEETDRGRIAMTQVPAHLARLECYTCHAAWTPQRYGCYIEMDFSDPSRKGIDWVRASNDPAQAESSSPEPTLEGNSQTSTGYLRWEEPVLGINGEGRISPLIPGCQTAYTIIGTNGQVIAEERMAENPPEAEAAGQSRIPLAMDTAPAQPHTSTAGARSCESCHTLPKTLGLGIGGSLFKTTPDWSRLIDEEGTQVATVGSHWPASRAFNKSELEKILRSGTCVGCHGAGQTPEMAKGKAGTREAHMKLMEDLLKQSGPRAGREKPSTEEKQ